MAKKAAKPSPSTVRAKTPGAAASAPAGGRLLPPERGAVVRMYRIGHGDCFLIALAGEKKGEPVYVLIDCGYKPGSSAFIKTTAQEVTQSIREATGGRIHLAVITHEHQDHVNGITEGNFAGIAIDQTWLAWTEDPADEVANQLRKIYKDKLLGLLAARNHLAATAGEKSTYYIDRYLALELGGDEGANGKFNAAAAQQALLGAAGTGGSANKQSMKIFKDRAKQVRFIRPHDGIHTLPGAKDVRVYALGPPRNVDKLQNLDPEGPEEFHTPAMAAASAGNYFGAAAAAVEAARVKAADAKKPAGAPAEGAPGRRDLPFARRYREEWETAFTTSEHAEFFNKFYGRTETASHHCVPDEDWRDERVNEAAFDAPWRRIDRDWLQSADQLALAMNSDTNNASLVLAFELGKGGKVLLFAGDAQRGNWLSWSDGDWTEGDKKVTAKDLLSRTVLYKAGHHCSHNATLNGQASDPYPNLSWMGAGKYGEEFTAMITAVWDWAKTQDGWIHPFPPIKEALVRKAAGRVFQTDTDFDKLAKPAGTTDAEWKKFRERTTASRLYFDYVIPA